jgi:hypothetical protein
MLFWEQKIRRKVSGFLSLLALNAVQTRRSNSNSIAQQVIRFPGKSYWGIAKINTPGEILRQHNFDPFELYYHPVPASTRIVAEGCRRISTVAMATWRWGKEATCQCLMRTMSLWSLLNSLMVIHMFIPLNCR